jgi:hypothetical protein
MLGIIMGVILLNLCVIYLRYETEILLRLFPEIDEKPVLRRRICKKQPARAVAMTADFTSLQAHSMDLLSSEEQVLT